MKPLELTVYPKSRGMFGAQYDMPDGRHMLAAMGADVISRNKRLTDAELAAEHHAANAAAWRLTAFRSYNKDEVEQSEHEFHTLRRFATLPHYDEATL